MVLNKTHDILLKLLKIYIYQNNTLVKLREILSSFFFFLHYFSLLGEKKGLESKIKIAWGDFAPFMNQASRIPEADKCHPRALTREAEKRFVVLDENSQLQSPSGCKPHNFWCFLPRID